MKIPIIAFSCPLLPGSTALAVTHYVDINSTNPVSPYVSWETSATNIQLAIDVAVDGETVLVNDGTYAIASEIT